MRDLIWWFNQSNSNGGGAIDENKLYKVKLNANDVAPAYIQDKIDNETISIYKNKITSILRKEVQIPLSVNITVINNTDKIISKDDLVLIDISDTPLIDLSTFALYDDTGNIIDYAFYDSDNQKYITEKTELIVIKSPTTINPGDTVQISAQNIPYTVDLQKIYYLYIPRFDDSVQLWDSTNTNVTTGFYKRNTPQITNDVLVLDSNDGIRSVQKYTGDIILEVVGKAHSNRNEGSFCRLATNDNYGYVRDGGANIIDLLFWNNNRIFYEWNNGERSWIRYPVNVYQKHKIILSTEQNKITYQIDNNTVTHTGGLISEYYIYLYSYSGRLTIKELYAYKPAIATLDISNVTVNDNTVKILNTKIDLYFENGEPKVVAKLLETGEILEFLNPDDSSDLIKRPKIIQPEYDGIITYENIIASEYTTSNTFNGQHTSSDWEISTNEYFTQLVFSSYNDTENLTSLDTLSLDNGTYYVRVRYRSNNIVSKWSFPLKFNIERAIKVQEISWNSDKLIGGHTYILTINASSNNNTTLTYQLTCDNSNVIIESTSNPNEFRVTFPEVSEKVYYNFTIEISDDTNTITIEREYEVIPAIIPDIFGDGSCKTLIKFDNNTNTDVFGNSNISVIGTPRFTDDGIYGSAFYAINNNGILINNFPSIINPNAYSVSVWVKFFANKDGQILMAGPYHFELAYFYDGYIKVAYARDHWRWYNVAKPQLDRYTHIVYTFQNTSTKIVKVYIDGVLKLTGLFSQTSGPSKFSIAYRYDCCGGAHIKKAYFDQLRFFNRILTDEEVAQLYELRQ